MRPIFTSAAGPAWATSRRQLTGSETPLFHNLTSHRILYFTVRQGDPKPSEGAWLGSQPAVLETKYLRHLRLSDPLRIKVDGRSGRGVILRRPDRP